MRPTRFTFKRRRTKYGKGGWWLRPGMYSYMDPITGNGYGSDKLKTLLKMRRKEEAKLKNKPPAVKGVTWEP